MNDCKHKARSTNIKTGQEFCQDCHKLLHDNEFVSFSAVLGATYVRLTVSISDLEIVSPDNVKSYEINRNTLSKLNFISFEDIY